MLVAVEAVVQMPIPSGLEASALLLVEAVDDSVAAEAVVSVNSQASERKTCSRLVTRKRTRARIKERVEAKAKIKRKRKIMMKNIRMISLSILIRFLNSLLVAVLGLDMQMHMGRVMELLLVLVPLTALETAIQTDMDQVTEMLLSGTKMQVAVVVAQVLETRGLSDRQLGTVYLTSKVVEEVVPRVEDTEFLVMPPLNPFRHRMQPNLLYV
jgi:hypothetical protein